MPTGRKTPTQTQTHFLCLSFQTHKLVEVTSNLWGTKFRLHGLASFLPEDLGQVLYKTSLLHLQPRQMTVSILELTPELHPHARDPGYNPNQFSESDDEITIQHSFQEHSLDGAIGPTDDVIPISPEAYTNQLAKLTSQSSTDTLGNNVVENGAIEVPVIIERHSLFQSNKTEKCTSNCSPFEIRSLDGSPPQRRSPSLKSRSLSPAEQQVTYTSNSLLGNGVDGDMFTREMYLDKGAHGIPKIRMNSSYQLTAEVVESESEIGEVQTRVSPPSVIQLAAKRLEDVFAIQQLLNCENGGQHTSSSGSEPGMSYRRNSSNSSDNGIGCLLHSSNSSDGSSPPIETTVCMELHHVEYPSQQPARPARWADKACQEIKYIDDDFDDIAEGRKEGKEAVFCSAEGMSAREIMASTQMLAELDQTSTRTSISSSDQFTYLPLLSGTLAMTANSIELHKKRLVLAPPPEHKEHKDRKSLRTRFHSELQNARNSLELIHRSERTQSGAYLDDSQSSSRSDSPKASVPTSPVLGERHCYVMRRSSVDTKNICPRRGPSTEIADRDSKQSASLPTSPVRRIVLPQQKRARSKQDLSVTKPKMKSPLLRRRLKNYKAVDSSDEEILLSGDDVTTSENYKNLETFQKAQLSKKVCLIFRHSFIHSLPELQISPFCCHMPTYHCSYNVYGRVW